MMLSLASTFNKTKYFSLKTLKTFSIYNKFFWVGKCDLETLAKFLLWSCAFKTRCSYSKNDDKFHLSVSLRTFIPFMTMISWSPCKGLHLSQRMEGKRLHSIDFWWTQKFKLYYSVRGFPNLYLYHLQHNVFPYPFSLRT